MDSLQCLGDQNDFVKRRTRPLDTGPALSLPPSPSWPLKYFMAVKYFSLHLLRGFPDGSAGKEPTCNAGNTGDVGSIPGVGKMPRIRKLATHSSILAWKIPWTEKPGRLQSMGLQRIGPDLATKHASLT